MTLVRLDVTHYPLLDGKRFGDVGAYEKLIGEAEFAVDPKHALNSVIVDLDLAPRDADGRVHFTADVRILRPTDPTAGNRGAFLEVVNRGNSIFCRMLEPGPMNGSTGITEGFLLRRGFTVVTCGWQHDVPRGAGRFGLTAPEAIAVRAPVTGAGLLALRDIASHLKQNGLEFAIALGSSQSGRLLRHLVYLGLCEGEDGRLALDGCSSAAIVHLSAALGHISSEGEAHADLTLPENVRNYLSASTQHAPSALNDLHLPRHLGVYPPNTIDYKPFVRAAVDNLTHWVTRGVEPLPSAYPRFADGTLTADLRPAVDDDGNEVAGVRHPDISVPLATCTGWNPSADDPNLLVRALGSTIPFAPEVIARRYPSRDSFLTAVREAAMALVRKRYLLADDVAPVVDLSARRWDLLATQTCLA